MQTKNNTRSSRGLLVGEHSEFVSESSILSRHCEARSNPRKIKIYRGFTLVELIVVITILVIIGTIAFLNLSGFQSSARDANRIENLTNLKKGLDIVQIKSGKYPLPENSITLTASGPTNIIGYQGFAKDQVGSLARLSSNGTLDPLDSTIYTTYSVNVTQSKMQLMSFLEDENNITAYSPPLQRGIKGDFSLIPEANASVTSDYSQRFPTVLGDTLGILLSNGTGSTKNQPVQETGTGVDVVLTNSGYTAVFGKNSSVSGSGGVLSIMKNTIASCKTILMTGQGKSDGVYTINPTGTGSFSVYCDMTTDGGGWTMINTNLLGTADNKDTILQYITNPQGGINIDVNVQNVNVCSNAIGTTIFVANTISWQQIRADYKFYGANSCWGIFGNKYITTNLDDNVITFDPAIDIIRNEQKMRTSTGDTFDGITSRCDNLTDTNFWHFNKGVGERGATVILRKQDLNISAGLHTDIQCSDPSTSWKYENIFVK